MAKSIEWTCEYRNCDAVFKRYQCYVDKGIKRFCCQRHASLENAAIEKQNNNYKNRNIPTYECKWCDSVTQNTSLSCNDCKRVEKLVKEIRKQSGVLDEFTPIDYTLMLEKQNGMCGICGIERCSTGRKFSIDHDHITGKVRGLLCVGCNIRLGWYENKKNDIELYLNGM